MHSRRNRRFTVSYFEFQQLAAGDVRVDPQSMNLGCGDAQMSQQPAHDPFINQRSGALRISHALGYVRIAGRISYQ